MKALEDVALGTELVVDPGERAAGGDPRPSVRERYPTKADYMSRITAAVLALRRRHLLLDEDAIRILEKASGRDLWSE